MSFTFPVSLASQLTDCWFVGLFVCLFVRNGKYKKQGPWFFIEFEVVCLQLVLRQSSMGSLALSLIHMLKDEAVSSDFFTAHHLPSSCQGCLLEKACT